MKCKICQEREAVDTHHLLKTTLGGRDEEWNKVAVCRRCHRALESIFSHEFWRKAVDRYVETCREVDETAEAKMCDICGLPWTKKEEEAGAHFCR